MFVLPHGYKVCVNFTFFSRGSDLTLVNPKLKGAHKVPFPVSPSILDDFICPFVVHAHSSHFFTGTHFRLRTFALTTYNYGNSLLGSVTSALCVDMYRTYVSYTSPLPHSLPHSHITYITDITGGITYIYTMKRHFDAPRTASIADQPQHRDSTDGRYAPLYRPQ